MRRLRWRLLSGPGRFLFFLLNWALCGPNRPLTGLGRVVPHLGWKPATRGLLRATRGLVGFVGRLNVGGFPKCRKERKGRTIPLEGIGQDLRHLMGIFSRVQEGNVQGCTLELLHNM